MTAQQKAMLLQIENACRNFEVCLQNFSKDDFVKVEIPVTISNAQLAVKKLRDRIRHITNK